MKTALLLIDIQMDYFPGGAMELSGSEAAAAKAGRALEYCRTQDMPVFHIQHVSRRPGATFFLPDTPGVAIHPYVAPREGERVIEKHYPNSFRETPLEAELRALKIERLVIAGMMTHMCVDATTRQAFDLGFSCILLPDACATRDLDFGHVTVPAAHVHGAFMAALGSVYAELTGVKDLPGALR
jgi:nicotinamidase-related amidase